MSPSLLEWMQSVQAAQEPMFTARIKAKEVKAKLTRKKGTVTVLIKNPKAAAANPTRTGKVTRVPRAVIAIARRNPKVVAARPTRMGKGNMATKVVMENLMATKKHQPMEGIEGMVRVLLNTSCHYKYKLGLTDAQIKTMKKLDVDFKKKIIQANADHEMAHLELDLQVHSGEVDEGKNSCCRNKNCSF